MSRFEDKRFEVGLKILARNDSYLSNVNTKSTILLTLSSAIIAAVALNYNRFDELVNCPPFDRIFSLFIVVSILFFMAAIAVSLHSIYPNVSRSNSKNMVSFVDVVGNYKDEEEYAKAFEEEVEEDLVSEVASLNYNLSKALVKKNKSQRLSIVFIGLALIALLVAVLMVIVG